MIDENEIKITVNCDGCDNSDYGTRAELEAVGWQITESSELCTLCRFD
jgi:transketolase